jgi:hypothetical protein
LGKPDGFLVGLLPLLTAAEDSPGDAEHKHHDDDEEDARNDPEILTDEKLHVQVVNLATALFQAETLTSHKCKAIH